MIRAGEALHGARTASRFDGIVGEARIIDWRRVIAAKDDLVVGLRQKKYIDLLPQYEGVSYVEGKARLADGGVAVGDHFVRAPKIVITTGARPAVPPIPGIDRVSSLTSTSLLELDVLPKSLIVVGGGFIGAELAQMMARMGVAVTVVCRSRLLPQAEPEVSEAPMDVFRREGIQLYCGVAYDACREDAAGITLCVKDEGERIELRAEKLLIATGRAPNVEGLGLAEAGVAQDERAPSPSMHTCAPAELASTPQAMTNRDQFVYMAAYGAKLAARNALGSDTLAYDNAAMPGSFTDPQVAGVGLLKRKPPPPGMR